MVPARRLTAGFRRIDNLTLRLIAGVYALAFLSFGSQVEGLVGPSGLWPAGAFLDQVQEQFSGALRFFYYPSVFWLGNDTTWLVGGCVAGLLCAIAAGAGIFPMGAFAGCFLLYLSFYTISGPFLRFQWDILLMEAGFLALLASPIKSYRSGTGVPTTVIFLFRFLVFKLMFVSGWCKLASGDPTWRTLTALHFHFETQPLPPWTAWYFHHLPDGALKFCTAATLIIELVFPFLIWLGRRARLVAFWAFVLLQAAIMLSGNYGFFNWLTIALCFSLLDFVWKKPGGSPALSPAAARGWMGCIAVVLIVPISIYLSSVRWLDNAPRVPAVERWVVAPLQSWPIVGTYGLFSVMTTDRNEIVIEGSNDGEKWMPYEFRFKPGDPSRRPAFTGPHMPRLDWQMWFAAMGQWRQNPWLIVLCRRLLEAEPAALRLLSTNPFPTAPPSQIRLRLKKYRFSSARPGSSEPWWLHEPIGEYSPRIEKS